MIVWLSVLVSIKGVFVDLLVVVFVVMFVVIFVVSSGVDDCVVDSVDFDVSVWVEFDVLFLLECRVRVVLIIGFFVDWFEVLLMLLFVDVEIFGCFGCVLVC